MTFVRVHSAEDPAVAEEGSASEDAMTAGKSAAEQSEPRTVVIVEEVIEVVAEGTVIVEKAVGDGACSEHQNRKQ